MDASTENMKDINLTKKKWFHGFFVTRRKTPEIRRWKSGDFIEKTNRVQNGLNLS